MATQTNAAVNLNLVLDQVAKDKGIDRSVLVSTLEDAMNTAAKKHFGQDRNLEAKFDSDKGVVELFQAVTVVEEITDPAQAVNQLPLDEARKKGMEVEAGDELVLCPYLHHDVTSPYRASGPIYVRRAATHAAQHVDIVPDALRRRLLSVRAYDRDGDLQDAEVAPGTELAALVARWFADPAIAYLHAHHARPGCFAAVVQRAGDVP